MIEEAPRGAGMIARIRMRVRILRAHTPTGPHRPEAQDVALSRPKHGFESRWGRHHTCTRHPADDPACEVFHMKDANVMRGELSVSHGWTRDAVTALVHDRINQCLAPRGRHRDPEHALIGTACSVDLAAYERVCQEYPHFRGKTPEALCVDQVATYCADPR